LARRNADRTAAATERRPRKPFTDKTGYGPAAYTAQTWDSSTIGRGSASWRR
jgi:hypothetical protein